MFSYSGIRTPAHPKRPKLKPGVTTLARGWFARLASWPMGRTDGLRGPAPDAPFRLRKDLPQNAPSALIYRHFQLQLHPVLGPVGAGSLEGKSVPLRTNRADFNVRYGDVVGR